MNALKARRTELNNNPVTVLGSANPPVRILMNALEKCQQYFHIFNFLRPNNGEF
jgi:hypothetical protein